MSKNIIKKFKILISITCLTSIFLYLIFSKMIANTMIKSITICTNILIPSIFIFLIISEFFYKTNALNLALKPFSLICEKLFKIDRKLGPILFFSLICGYPAGANLITKLVKKKIISKKTATRMLYFCVNSGPAFLIGGISIPLSGSINFGIILFISQITAFFLVGIFSSIGEKIEKVKNVTKTKYTISSALISSVRNSTKNMAIICGLTLLFSVIINFFLDLNFLNINSHKFLKPLFSGLLEITNGIVICDKINNISIFMIIALITSFGGICVHFQILAITSKEKIPFENFYFWRIIYCLTSMIVSTTIFTKFLKENLIETQKNTKSLICCHTPIVSISLIILTIALLCCDKKIIIIKKKINKKLD